MLCQRGIVSARNAEHRKVADSGEAVSTSGAERALASALRPKRQRSLESRGRRFGRGAKMEREGELFF